jgi:hypothetical protein
MVKGLTLGKRGDDYGNESGKQEYAYALEHNLVAPSPDVAGYTLEELGDGEFAHPYKGSVADARCQDKLGAPAAEAYLMVGEAFGLHIVGARDENDMNQSHAREQRKQTQTHDAILLEQMASPNHPPSQARKDDDDGKGSTPPAEE